MMGGNPATPAIETTSPFWWSEPTESVLGRLRSSASGLASGEAAHRLREVGPNTLQAERDGGALRILLRQFANPLVLILLVGACISLLVRDLGDAAIIVVIVAGSALLGFTQEHRASRAVARLRQRLALQVDAWRDGALARIDARNLVPGDVVRLAAGNRVPADGLVLEARDFLVSEAALTGESFPVEKHAGVVSADAPLVKRINCVHLGTSVRSGFATVLVVRTGAASAYGAIAHRLAAPEEETEFARGLRHFGYLLLRVMLVMVVFVLAANHLLGRPVIESLLFAIALAVGLSPELLPAIVSVTLAHGAQAMAARGVIVRRLEAIENLGSIDVLCTDKTGTLTAGVVALDSAADIEGRESARVRELAFLNATFETGIDNPLDAAIVAAGERAGFAAGPARKIDEIPYDFERRRLTVVVAPPGVDRRRVARWQGVAGEHPGRLVGEPLTLAQQTACRGVERSDLRHEIPCTQQPPGDAGAVVGAVRRGGRVTFLP